MEVIQNGPDHDGHDHLRSARPPMLTEVTLLQIPHGAQRRAESVGTTTRKHDRPDGLDHAGGLKHNRLQVARFRTIVVDAPGGAILKEYDSAAGRPLRICKVPNFHARNVRDVPSAPGPSRPCSAVWDVGAPAMATDPIKPSPNSLRVVPDMARFSLQSLSIFGFSSLCIFRLSWGPRKATGNKPFACGFQARTSDLASWATAVLTRSARYPGPMGLGSPRLGGNGGSCVTLGLFLWGTHPFRHGNTPTYFPASGG